MRCTSCKPGFVLAIRFAKSKAGSCEKVENFAHKKWCTIVGENSYGAKPSSPNMLCTKWGLSVKRLRVDQMASPKSRAWFKDVMPTSGPHRGQVIAKCESWKAVSCHGGKCAVKKAVRCRAVCKKQGYGGARGMLGDCSRSGKQLAKFMDKAVEEVDTVYAGRKTVKRRKALSDKLLSVQKAMCKTEEICSEKLCQGEHGRLVCKQVAMML